METIKDRILEEYKKGNIVCSTVKGLQVANIDAVIEQGIEGLLYDINRDEATILTLIDDPKWVNDYALTVVIRKLYKKIDKLEAKIKEHDEAI